MDNNGNHMDNNVKSDNKNIQEEHFLGGQIRRWITANYKSLKAFSREENIPYPTLNHWISGARKPSWEKMNQLIELGFDPTEQYMEGSMLSRFAGGIYAKEDSPVYKLKEEPSATQIDPRVIFDDDPDPRDVNFVFVKMLDIEASAGQGRIVESEYEDDEYAFNRKWIMSKGLSDSKLSVIKVAGDSMSDTLNDGEMLLVKNDSPPIDKKIFVVSHKGELFVKRLRLMRQGWVATSDNPQYDPIELDESSVFVGLVISAMRDMD